MSWFFQPVLPSAVVQSAAGGSKVMMFSVAEVAALYAALSRTRNVTSTIAEVETLSAVLKRSRTMSASIAEVIAYTIAVDKGGQKTFTLSIAETKSYVLAFTRARNITASVAEIEALSVQTLARTRAMLASIAESETVLAPRNTIQYSEDMRNTAEAGVSRLWNQYVDGNTSVVLANVLGPFGTPVSASRVQLTVDDASTAVQKGAAQQLARPDSTSYTVSAYIKGDQVQRLRLLWSSKTVNTWPTIQFDLTTGANTPATSNGVTPIAAGSVDLGNGWYRVWGTFDSGIAGNSSCGPSFQLYSAAGNYAGTAGDGFYVWGVQVELGAVMGAYQATNLLPSAVVQRTRPATASIVETETLTGSLNRFRSAALAVAEVFGYSFTFADNRSKLFSANIAEIETHSFGALRRTRGVVTAVNEILVFAESIVRARKMALTVAESEALAELLNRNRAVQTSLSEVEVLNALGSRNRATAFTIAELETVNANIGKLKLMAYVVAQTEGHSFWMARARKAVVAINELDAVQASFNRARALVVPIAESETFNINFGRLRKQVFAINESQGTAAAIARIRKLLQSIANTTNYTFTVGVYGVDPTSLSILVQWNEWNYANDVHTFTPRSETLTLQVKTTSTQTVMTSTSAVLTVPNDPSSLLAVLTSEDSTLIIPNNAL